MPAERTSRDDRPRRTQYCTFRLDDLLLGIEVQRVQEVIRPQPMTSVPLAPAGVQGLINLRGQIVTAVDLRHRLGMAPRADDGPRMNAVIRLDDEAVSLLVDEAGDVVEPDTTALEPVPPTVSSRIRALVTGAYKLPDGLLLVLDPEMIAAADPEPALSAATLGTNPSRRTS